jgi:hypothetical protein
MKSSNLGLFYGKGEKTRKEYKDLVFGACLIYVCPVSAGTPVLSGRRALVSKYTGHGSPARSARPEIPGPSLIRPCLHAEPGPNFLA